ncbi:methylmalonyl Co-A mutase-associated GTPase MeaB [Mucilaginibacter conchicola]|uniref:Methylmalonyl Co-A mutase-associated GTPase MeaB n=1 Tax=Mucilaginibacter conchicola TaxID=2303333 RepID=A0A372NSQ0_9SPHI|nr:methylmalonyl Co-A mutase-associated GTPase MeaB [Mucilaginibacter conchicola]RFZ92152.1 methylmalonyl Co-A mutase-associated GTPase MeaB [Mucilaginibacter conchicola]
MSTPLNIDINLASGFRQVARALTMVENNLKGYDELLKSLPFSNTPITGITGPPGAGKSTLVNAIISGLLAKGKKVAILAIDPTSPFNFGSLLGDRIRMATHFNHPDVFIRSLATRGSLGGLSAKTIEMTEVLKAAGFDHIIVETVGVGQSEVEIAGLADQTFVTLVPEAGDEIQNIKSGLMEIADAFIINKADRDGADLFINNLKKILHHDNGRDIPVLKTVASKNEGIDAVVNLMLSAPLQPNTRKELLLAEKVYHIIQQRRMQGVDKKKLRQQIAQALSKGGFNMYRFAAEASSKSQEIRIRNQD